LATVPFFLVYSSLFSLSPMTTVGKTSSKTSVTVDVPSHSIPSSTQKMNNGGSVNKRVGESFKNDKKQRRLDCVIHVGLFKTGTTTIQGAFYDHLVNDTYYFIGHQSYTWSYQQNRMTPKERRLKNERDVVRTYVKVHDERGGCSKKVYNQVSPPNYSQPNSCICVCLLSY
jgi:hypothetical protein